MVVSLFKKNKIMYPVIIFIIFLDLFTMGHFDEKSLPNIYKDKPEIAIFQENNKNDYRILPIINYEEGNIFQPNQNIYFDYYYTSGYSPLILRDYAILFNITDVNNLGWIQHTDWQTLLRNNNVLSVSNTKYIIVPRPDNIDNFNNSITKHLWKNVEPVIKESYYEKIEYNNSRFLDDKTISIKGDGNTLSYFSIPIKIDSNKKYMISFYIKEERISKIDNIIYFDFFGSDYDDSMQEFFLELDDIGTDYKYISRVLNSENIPEETDIRFRIYANAIGEVNIKDLEIHEVKSYINYKAIHEGDDVLVLENNNILPRFYFPSEINNANNTMEAKRIIWEENSNWDQDRFDPKKSAVVENIDFNKTEFSVKDAKIKVIDYRNNEVALETSTNNDSFLVFSDSYYPGWKAYIDNNETKIYKTNGMFKGIYITEGEHIVIFKYIPTGLIIGIIVSLATIISMIITIIILFYRKRKNYQKVSKIL